ncbi:hypothetical protein QBC42DRAFT_35874 [Cladorrhinum samala]|uniref:Secreted protein n=1 Tax=Cladorrhinum samala TaxID=585594 RepID=A0AAV9HYA3_9PEZI|nr:hypothetical protein QBC42DRAFT_35874 [Cladorrhinum samala]
MRSTVELTVYSLLFSLFVCWSLLIPREPETKELSAKQIPELSTLEPDERFTDLDGHPHRQSRDVVTAPRRQPCHRYSGEVMLRSAEIGRCARGHDSYGSIPPNSFET